MLLYSCFPPMTFIYRRSIGITMGKRLPVAGKAYCHFHGLVVSDTPVVDLNSLLESMTLQATGIRLGATVV